MALIKEKIEVAIGESELKVQNQFSQFPKFLRWFIIVSLIGFIPAYFGAKAISNYYWQKQYSTSLTLAKPSFTQAKEPTVQRLDITSLGPGKYAAVATVINENLDLSLENGAYQFNFFNNRGESVYKETKNFFLLPNQKKYLVAPNISSSDEIISGTLTFPNKLNWQKRINIPQVQLLANKPGTYNQLEPLAFVAEGSVVNNSPYNLGQIRLAFLLLDNSGKIIGTSQRYESTLMPTERRAYKQLWPGIYSTEVAETKVIAETNTLDGTNLNLPKTQITPASDLDRPQTNPNQNP